MKRMMEKNALVGIIYHPVITSVQLRWKNHSNGTTITHIHQLAHTPACVCVSECWRNINTFDCNCMFGIV